jgi:putative ABC transport system substrate-binding protein
MENLRAGDRGGGSIPRRAGDRCASPGYERHRTRLALDIFARQPNGGLILTSDTFTTLRGSLIADLARRYRLPSIALGASFARNGGLMYYGTDIDLAGEYRRAATYVDRILKDSKLGDLPVQAPDKYTFAINLKTAKALGLTISETFLATADEVIQ